MKNFFKKLVFPVSQDEDRARGEFILNVLLLSIIGLSFTAFFINITEWLISLDNPISVGIIFVILAFFIFLYFLSRKGFFIIVSYFFLSILFLFGSYMWYQWGIDVPFGILVHTLVIIMSGILISARFAFLVAGIIGVIMIAIGHWQQVGVLAVNQYWKSEAWTVIDTAVAVIIFLIIATVSWLSNREIEKSLTRARRSEAELKKERDSLEITIEARTRELKETQAEKMTQLYRFAEFGRLSSGLFHDLINPLTAVSLNIEQLKNKHTLLLRDAPDKNVSLEEASYYTEKAVRAAKKMEDMVSAVRKQLSRQENKTLFSVNNEITQALEVLAHKAQKAGVAIRLFSREEIKTYGDAIKFNQIALNLIVNAIDAYQEKTNIDSKTVTMSLSREDDVIVLEVKDKGVGIPEENKPRVFEPFFTTKKEGYGLGIGLSMIKRIIEKDFGGNISVASKEGAGSVFTVKFPQKQNG